MGLGFALRGPRGASRGRAAAGSRGFPRSPARSAFRPVLPRARVPARVGVTRAFPREAVTTCQGSGPLGRGRAGRHRPRRALPGLSPHRPQKPSAFLRIQESGGDFKTSLLAPVQMCILPPPAPRFRLLAVFFLVHFRRQLRSSRPLVRAAETHTHLFAARPGLRVCRCVAAPRPAGSAAGPAAGALASPRARPRGRGPSRSGSNAHSRPRLRFPCFPAASPRLRRLSLVPRGALASPFLCDEKGTGGPS